MDTHRKTQLVCDAVKMATANRGGKVAGVIHHRDHGGEYTSRDLERELRRCEALASMGSVPDGYDNPMAESFFATLETELFWAQPNRRFDSHREAKLAIFDYIEVFYNRQRRHTSIGGIPPVAFETRHAEQLSMTLRNPVSAKTGELQLVLAQLRSWLGCARS